MILSADPVNLSLTDRFTASDWVKRWTHLAKPLGSVLDVACGSGRHMAWFAQHGQRVTGVDRSQEAALAASQYGTSIQADIENGPWPLMHENHPAQFDVVMVTNYLWRPLFPVLLQSLAPGGLFLYETFAIGNRSVGKPSRPDFLLQPAELLAVCKSLQVVAFEDGFLPRPERFVQRIAAIAPEIDPVARPSPARYALSLE